MTGLIVLEGANSTGKSFTAKYLEEKYGAVVFHQTYRFRDKIFAYHTAVLRKAIEMSKKRLVVLDRLWMSEAVYAKVYRTGTPWPHQGRMVDRLLLSASAVTIVCYDPDDDRLSKRFSAEAAKRGRTDVKATNNLRVNSIYYQLFSGDRTDKTYSYFDEVFRRPDILCAPFGFQKDVAEAAISSIMARKKMKSEALETANFLGDSSRATILFAGDTENLKGRHKSWPFYEYGNSSLFLAKALSVINFDETRAMWTNVNSPDGGSDVAFFLKDSSLRFVALGNKAEKTLSSIGIQSVKIDHPQYGRRFLSLANYAEQLQFAIGE